MVHVLLTIMSTHTLHVGLVKNILGNAESVQFKTSQRGGKITESQSSLGWKGL